MPLQGAGAREGALHQAHAYGRIIFSARFAKRGRIKGKFHGHAPQVPEFLHTDDSRPGSVKPCLTSRSPRLGSSKAWGGDVTLGYISPTCRCLHRHLPVETVGQTHL